MLAKTPIIAKLGIVCLGTISLLGFGGFLMETLTKKSGTMLAIGLSSLLSSVALLSYTVKRNGILSYLPEDLETPLFQWTILDLVREMNANFDMEKVVLLTKEMAPLALAANEEEVDKIIKNMSGEWQKVFKTRGLIGLLPPPVQKALLPQGFSVLPPPPVPDKPADIPSQVKLFKELAVKRIVEKRDELATTSYTAYTAKITGEAVTVLSEQLKQATSYDKQIWLIMAFLSLLVTRYVFAWVYFILQKVLSMVFFFL